MKGHYFLKWLFLTVLSVSILHFRENSNFGHYRIEQVSSSDSTSKKSFRGFSYFKKPSEVQPAGFVEFKNTQYIRLAYLSNLLSTSISRYPAFRLHRTSGILPIQNQHFRSRTLPSDDFSISRS